MRTYKDLLDFKDQRIVDEVYKRYKNDRDNEELDQVYQEITSRNQTKIQTTQYRYQIIMDYISKILGIIGMMFFAFLFVFSGSLILAFFGMWLHVYAFEGANPGLFEWMIDFGKNIYNTFFASGLAMNANEVIQMDPSIIQMFYVLGLTVLLIIFFIILYVISLIRKERKKNVHKEEIVLQEDNVQIEKTEAEIKKEIERSYRFLQVNEDDSWDYIHSQLKRKLRRKNKDFFDRYYDSYICLFDYHQDVEGSFQSLTTTQKIILCIRTITNSIKNVFGTFAKPIFFSAVFVSTFYRTFPKEGLNQFSFDMFLSTKGNTKFIIGILDFCYGFVAASPFQFLIKIVPDYLMLNKMISLCVVISLIYVLESLFKNKIRESIRQYNRRKNYYLKKNQGIYDENHRYTKDYLYSLEFTVFVVFISLILGYNYYYSSMSHDVSKDALNAYENSTKITRNIAIKASSKYKNPQYDSTYGLEIEDYGKEGKDGYLKKGYTVYAVDYYKTYGLSYEIRYMINEDYAKEEYNVEKNIYLSLGTKLGIKYKKNTDLENAQVSCIALNDGYVYYVVRQGTIVYIMDGEIKDMKKNQKMFDVLKVDYEVPTKKEVLKN